MDEIVPVDAVTADLPAGSDLRRSDVELVVGVVVDLTLPTEDEEADEESVNAGEPAGVLPAKEERAVEGRAVNGILFGAVVTGEVDVAAGAAVVVEVGFVAVVPTLTEDDDCLMPELGLVVAAAATVVLAFVAGLAIAVLTLVVEAAGIGLEVVVALIRRVVLVTRVVDLVSVVVAAIAVVAADEDVAAAVAGIGAGAWTSLGGIFVTGRGGGAVTAADAAVVSAGKRVDVTEDG